MGIPASATSRQPPLFPDLDELFELSTSTNRRALRPYVEALVSEQPTSPGKPFAEVEEGLGKAIPFAVVARFAGELGISVGDETVETAMKTMLLRQAAFEVHLRERTGLLNVRMPLLGDGVRPEEVLLRYGDAALGPELTALRQSYRSSVEALRKRTEVDLSRLVPRPPVTERDGRDERESLQRRIADATPSELPWLIAEAVAIVRYGVGGSAETLAIVQPSVVARPTGSELIRSIVSALSQSNLLRRRSLRLLRAAGAVDVSTNLVTQCDELLDLARELAFTNDAVARLAYRLNISDTSKMLPLLEAALAFAEGANEQHLAALMPKASLRDIADEVLSASAGRNLSSYSPSYRRVRSEAELLASSLRRAKATTAERVRTPARTGTRRDGFHNGRQPRITQLYPSYFLMEVGSGAVASGALAELSKGIEAAVGRDQNVETDDRAAEKFLAYRMLPRHTALRNALLGRRASRGIDRATAENGVRRLLAEADRNADVVLATYTSNGSDGRPRLLGDEIFVEVTSNIQREGLSGPELWGSPGPPVLFKMSSDVDVVILSITAADNSVATIVSRRSIYEVDEHAHGLADAARFAAEAAVSVAVQIISPFQLLEAEAGFDIVMPEARHDLLREVMTLFPRASVTHFGHDPTFDVANPDRLIGEQPMPGASGRPESVMIGGVAPSTQPILFGDQAVICTFHEPIDDFFVQRRNQPTQIFESTIEGLFQEGAVIATKAWPFIPQPRYGRDYKGETWTLPDPSDALDQRTLAAAVQHLDALEDLATTAEAELLEHLFRSMATYVMSEMIAAKEANGRSSSESDVSPSGSSAYDIIARHFGAGSAAVETVGMVAHSLRQLQGEHAEAILRRVYEGILPFVAALPPIAEVFKKRLEVSPENDKVDVRELMAKRVLRPAPIAATSRMIELSAQVQELFPEVDLVASEPTGEELFRRATVLIG